MVCVDGGTGLLAALPMVYPGVPIQRCWAHKIRNVLAKVRLADQPAVKAHLHAVMNAKTRPQAPPAAPPSPDPWEDTHPTTAPHPPPPLAPLLTSSHTHTL